MATVQCPQCGFVTPIASELCAQCGLELPRAAYNSQQTYDRPQFTTELPPPPFGVTGELPTPYGLSSPIKPDVDVGNVIQTTLSLFLKNGWLITKLVFVIFAPFEIFKALSFGGDAAKNWQVVVGTTFLMLVCKMLIAPSLIFSLMTLIRTGTAPTLTEAYSWGLNKLPKIVPSAVMAWIVSGIGFLLLIIPGIILSMAFVPLYPIASLENHGPIETLKSSYNLTEGYRWKIFCTMFVIGAIGAAVNIPAGIITALLTVGGVQFWPLQAAVAVVVDIISEMTTVAALVIYLSLLTSRPTE